MGNDSDQHPEKQDKTEATLTMLKIYHERSNQLANMLVAVNGFMLAFISGLLAFVGSSAFSNSECKNATSFYSLISSGCLNPWPMFFTINIAIIALVLWRCYSHYIDEDIKETYCKILACENEIPINFNATLLKSLVEPAQLKSILTKEEIQRLYHDIFEKFEKGEFPNRGHKKLDCIAFFFIIILSIIEIILVILLNQSDFFIGVILPIAILAAWGFAACLIINQTKLIKKCKQYRDVEIKN